MISSQNFALKRLCCTKKAEHSCSEFPGGVAEQGELGSQSRKTLGGSVRVRVANLLRDRLRKTTPEHRRLGRRLVKVYRLRKHFG